MLGKNAFRPVQQLQPQPLLVANDDAFLKTSDNQHRAEDEQRYELYRVVNDLQV